METIRLICPDSKLQKKERIDFIIASFNKWVSSDIFVELVQKFGGDYNNNASTADKIIWLKESFINVWDYRGKQKDAITKEGEAARWLLKNDSVIEKNRELIYVAAKNLGLIGVSESIYPKADYILPLGGAKMSNLRRCELAASEAKRMNTPVKIIALSGMRPLSEDEFNSCISTYAPNAVTEYDAICFGMMKAFNSYEDTEIIRHDDSNPNLSHIIKHFISSKIEYDLYALAAPSSVPNKRSNSADCFKYLFEKFNIAENSKLINCTSEIYCSYQQVRSLFFAIDHNVEFDTIGFPAILSNTNPLNPDYTIYEPVNYLQEIKATIDAMYDFINHYINV